MELKFKQLREGAKLPQRATEGAAGMDLYACFEGEIVLEPLGRVLVPTGLAMELPGSGYVGLVFARSGLALREGLAMANGVGVIDSDYRGELSVPVVNLSNQPIHIVSGERVAQLVIMPVALPQVSWQQSLGETERGTGGFGSTGRT